MDQSSLEVAGAKVAFWTSGDGDPVLYLHGFPTSGFLWREVMAEVSSGYRAIAPDLPGFGDSELPIGPCTWESLVDWTGRFVDALGFDSVHLAVHDWGGLIGLAWACQHPGRISSLLVTDTSFSSKDRWHGMAQQWREPGVGESLIGEITRDGLGAMLEAVSPLPPESVDAYWSGLNTAERRQAKLDLYRSLEFEMLAPLEDSLSSVAPGRCSIVWGKDDPFAPLKAARRIAERLDCEVIELEANHFVPEERGPEVGRLHKSLLDAD